MINVEERGGSYCIICVVRSSGIDTELRITGPGLTGQHQVGNRMIIIV